jgi:uncharacterized OB-fold protein
MEETHRKRNIFLNFIENIRQGNFVLPYCKNCKKNIWPPANHCRICLNHLSLKNCSKKKGRILEILISKINNNINNNNNELMILVDIHEVILIGSLFLDTNINNLNNFKGKFVRIDKCGFINNKIFYQFTPCK